MSPAPVVIVAPTIVRYSFHHLLSGNRHFDSVWDISVEGDGVISRDSVLTDFNSHVNGYWQDKVVGPVLGTTTGFTGSDWIDLDSTTGATGVLGPAGGHPIVGTNPPPYAPHSVCYLIHKNSTAHRGQRQGRAYIPNIPEGKVGDDGILDGTFRSSIQTLMEAWRTQVGSYTYPASTANPAALRVVHVRKPAPDDATTWVWSSTTVNSLTCDPLAGTQRRRMRS